LLVEYPPQGNTFHLRREQTFHSFARTMPILFLEKDQNIGSISPTEAKMTATEWICTIANRFFSAPCDLEPALL